MNVKISKFLMASIGKWLPASYHPMGKLGNRFRYFCAKGIVKEIGSTATIEKGANLQTGVILKDHACVGVNCLVSSGTTIMEHAMMGPDCLIYTTNHKFDKELKRFEGFTEVKEVVIGEYAWLGARCIILPGVTIGKAAIIGAGSVVTKSVPDYHLAAGNPARVIKNLLD